ncbi:MAG: sterol desaturase family protein [Gammaproteobacteria bacterium]
MGIWITQHEGPLRLSAFLFIFIAMALWELAAPRRRLRVTKSWRWLNNAGLVVVSTVLLRIIFPAAAVGMAVFVQKQSWGLFNYYHWPEPLVIIAVVVIMDFMIYLQHIMVHAVPLLWRLHRVHHADLDIDVTTGARFHPLEIILSMLIKFAIIALLGAPAVAVIIFEVLLNATSMFNHSNVRMPTSVDKFLRAFLVTPDMHRVHHSVEDDETNSNFGFNLSWWDHLLGTYAAQPRAGHENMQIGIHTFRDEKLCARLPGMLRIPFIGKVTEYAINRRTWKQGS